MGIFKLYTFSHSRRFMQELLLINNVMFTFGEPQITNHYYRCAITYYSPVCATKYSWYFTENQKLF